jgi:hypothetical protein
MDMDANGVVTIRAHIDDMAQVVGVLRACAIRYRGSDIPAAHAEAANLDRIATHLYTQVDLALMD